VSRAGGTQGAECRAPRQQLSNSSQGDGAVPLRLLGGTPEPSFGPPPTLFWVLVLMNEIGKQDG
jgi:hypothetical protein